MWDREAGSNMRHRDLYSSPNATSIRMIKYGNMSCEGHMVHIRETRGTSRFWGENVDLKEETTDKT